MPGGREAMYVHLGPCMLTVHAYVQMLIVYSYTCAHIAYTQVCARVMDILNYTCARHTYNLTYTHATVTAFDLMEIYP